MSLLNELQTRGLIEQLSDQEELHSLLETREVPIYVGFDPTADSLHVGHLLPAMALARFQAAGHTPLVLVGGATGMVGDPSGRPDERSLLGPDEVARNAAAIRGQLKRFVSFEGANAAVMVDNADWLSGILMLEWLRDVGKHFTVNHMLAKESVRRRLEDRDHGISYTEFSYMLLQAYDFLHLHEQHGCMIQAGGNDQWGNITAGIEFVRRRTGRRVFGVTFPLVTTSTGEKFGKSVGNAVWLDAERTSPFEFYQYWVRTDDRDVAAYLRFFTFLPLDEIEALMSKHASAPGRRWAQTRLADEVTALVHGPDGLEIAQRATSVLYGGEISGLTEGELLQIFGDVESHKVPRAALEKGHPLVELLVAAGLARSKGAARRAITGGGIYLNNARVDDVEVTVTTADLVTETVLVIRSGKRRYCLIRVV